MRTKEQKSKDLNAIIGGIAALIIFVPIYASQCRNYESTPVKHSPAFEEGFNDGAIVGRSDAVERIGKKTWEQRDANAKRLSSDPDYQKGWRSGYDTGYSVSLREGPK